MPTCSMQIVLDLLLADSTCIKTCNDTCNVVTYMCCHYVSIIAYIFYSTIVVVVVVVVMLTSTSSTYPSTTGSFVELATAGARLLPCLCCLGLKDPELENGILAIFIVLNVIVALSQICFELIPINLSTVQQT